MDNQCTAKDIGKLVRSTRKSLAVTQENLALTSGTGLRFIIDLEHGKPTCQLEKTLTAVRTLRIKIELHPPAAAERRLTWKPANQLEI
jgi:HTH-type transcriptional regulator / antitoxin HipB